MREVVVSEPTLDAFRAAVRPLLLAHVEPAQVTLRDGDAQPTLFGALDVAADDRKPLRLPRAFFDRAERVACARDDRRWDLLYRVAFRLAHGEPDLMEIATDPDVVALDALDRAVKRDVHAMHAFVRFRRVDVDGQERFVAWYRPDHRTLRLAAPFFVDRFSSMRWTILTPEESVSWDGSTLRFGPGAPRDRAPSHDEMEALFRTYYENTFNPARTNLRAMARDMPARRQRDLPELANVAELVATADVRVAAMGARLRDAARPPVGPSRERATLPMLRDAAASCTACDIACKATQTVFGEGPERAEVMLVGEQPGDREDLEGRPFVGPAGALLDEVLLDLGVDRSQVYVTNAVKHFRWEPRGKQRIHRSPRLHEIGACRPWLDGEIAAVAPRTIVCLGAVAAKSFCGPTFRLLENRGRVTRSPWAERFLVTHHPSAILRTADAALRAELREELRRDLALAFFDQTTEGALVRGAPFDLPRSTSS